MYLLQNSANQARGCRYQPIKHRPDMWYPVSDAIPKQPPVLYKNLCLQACWARIIRLCQLYKHTHVARQVKMAQRNVKLTFSQNTPNVQLNTN